MHNKDKKNWKMELLLCTCCLNCSCVLLMYQINLSGGSYGGKSPPEALNHKVFKDFGHWKLLCLVRDAPKPQVRQEDRDAQVSSSSLQLLLEGL